MDDKEKGTYRVIIVVLILVIFSMQMSFNKQKERYTLLEEQFEEYRDEHYEY